MNGGASRTPSFILLTSSFDFARGVAMDSDPNLLDYRPQPDADRDALAAAGRGAGTWTALVVVWAVGLASWAVWLAAIGYMVVFLFAR